MCSSPHILGPQCEFDTSRMCSALSLNELYAQQFPTERSIATSFQLEGETSFYNRPVYRNRETNDTIIFTGVRWAVVDTLNIETLKEIGSSNDLRAISLLSEAVRYRSPEDVAPTNLKWFVNLRSGDLSSAELFEPSEPVVLLCSVCSITNPCALGSECLQGECHCVNGTQGSLCDALEFSLSAW